MILLRHVLQYPGKGNYLIAEARITEAEFNRMRTMKLIGMEQLMEFETVVYWYKGGFPPKPVMLGCPSDWEGRLIHEEAANHVNCKFQGKWSVVYKPVKGFK